MDLKDHRIIGKIRLEGIVMIIRCQPPAMDRVANHCIRLLREEAGQGPIGVVVPHVGTHSLHPAREIQRDRQDQTWLFPKTHYGGGRNQLLSHGLNSQPYGPLQDQGQG